MSQRSGECGGWVHTEACVYPPTFLRAESLLTTSRFSPSHQRAVPTTHSCSARTLQHNTGPHVPEWGENTWHTLYNQRGHRWTYFGFITDLFISNLHIGVVNPSYSTDICLKFYRTIVEVIILFCALQHFNIFSCT